MYTSPFTLTGQFIMFCWMVYNSLTFSALLSCYRYSTLTQKIYSWNLTSLTSSFNWSNCCTNLWRFILSVWSVGVKRINPWSSSMYLNVFADTYTVKLHMYSNCMRHKPGSLLTYNHWSTWVINFQSVHQSSIYIVANSQVSYHFYQWW